MQWPPVCPFLNKASGRIAGQQQGCFGVCERGNQRGAGGEWPHEPIARHVQMAQMESFTPEKASSWVQAAGNSYLGIFFGVAVVLGGGAGLYLDGRFGTKPWLLMSGVVLGLAASFKELWRLSRRFQKQLRRKA